MEKGWDAYDDEQVGVGARENRNVHGDAGTVRLVEPHAKVALSAQQQQDEHTNVYQANTGCIDERGAGIDYS